MTMTQILNGKILAKHVLNELKTKIDRYKDQGLRQPGLATILVGNDPASHVYVLNKRKRADETGITSFEQNLPSDITQAELIKIIEKLNDNPNIDGILVQLPLPAHIDTTAIICAVAPQKDVDGFNPENVGLLSLGKQRFVPCTPKGCMALIKLSQTPLLGAHAVIIGRSNIVGKPMAYLMLNTDATVTVCHRYTKDLKKITKQADILISAAGVPNLIGVNDIKSGAVVIDIGINRLANGKLVGDVDFNAVKNKAGAITPVPGGVGPMTISMLLENTVFAYELSQRLI